MLLPKNMFSSFSGDAKCRALQVISHASLMLLAEFMKKAGVVIGISLSDTEIEQMHVFFF